MASFRKKSPKIQIILVHPTNKSALSIFNSNAWEGNSKPIITSCATQYSLLEYQVTKLPPLIQSSQKVCEARFMELHSEWEKSPWDISRGDYLVEIPEFHLNIQSYLATIKTFLDLIVQLIASEGIVNAAVQGFHKKGDIAGGRLISILENNTRQEKNDKALKLLKFIDEQKIAWIDQVINVRDLMVHPEKGMSQVMFRLAIKRTNGKLIHQVLQPSLPGMQFDEYAQMTLMQVEYFSKNFLEIIKAA